MVRFLSCTARGEPSAPPRWREILPLTLLSALLGVLVSASAALVIQTLDSSASRVLVEEILGRSWTVAPGAALQGLAVARLMIHRRLRLLPRVAWGALVGAALAPLNVPLTAGLLLLAYGTPDGSSAGELLRDLIRSRDTLVIALPFAFLAGLYCGAVVAAFCGARSGRA